MIYGSGLRSGDFNTDHNAPYAQVNAGVSREFMFRGWNPVMLRFDVVNVFDVSYALRDGSGIGVFAKQYGPRRGFYFGLAQKFGPGANKPVDPHASSPFAGLLGADGEGHLPGKNFERWVRKRSGHDWLLYRRERRL